MVRESWMLELPEDKPNFCGFGPRKFLRQTPQEKGDRSGWTDTPADKARKAQVSAFIQQSCMAQVHESGRRVRRLPGEHPW